MGHMAIMDFLTTFCKGLYKEDYSQGWHKSFVKYIALILKKIFETAKERFGSLTYTHLNI
jgi:hypothetical protein